MAQPGWRSRPESNSSSSGDDHQQFLNATATTPFREPQQNPQGGVNLGETGQVPNVPVNPGQIPTAQETEQIQEGLGILNLGPDIRINQPGMDSGYDTEYRNPGAGRNANAHVDDGEGDDDYLQHGSESFVSNHRHIQELHRLSAFQQVTTKVPPSFDGRGSWFAYEDAIDDWCDITELDNDKRGPALRNRLEGEAAIKPVKVFWSQSSRPKEGKAAK